MWKKNYQQLSKAVGKGYSVVADAQDVRMNYELKNNVAVFAAFKAYRMGGDVKKLLVDEKGNKRQWGSFLKEYTKVNGKYNNQWLSAEYAMAQGKASAARQWQDFQRDKDTYPNLEYMPSRSAHERTAHTHWYGIIKPIDDSFWDTALPPSAWNCKCWVKQTRDDATDHQPEKISLPEGVVGNPGKTGMVFSPLHPYIAGLSKKEKIETVKKAFEQLRSSLDEEYIEYKGKEGKVRVSLNADPADYLDNFNYAKAVADNFPGVITILPNHPSHLEIKNPELNYRGATGDRVQWDGNSLKTHFNSVFSDKLSKKGQLKDYSDIFLAMDFLGKLTNDDVLLCARIINGRINNAVSSGRIKFFILKNDTNIVLIKKGDSFDEILTKAKELLKNQ